MKLRVTRKGVLLTTLGALLIGLLVYAALNWYELEDDEKWVGQQGEARTNPYLAMQRTIEAQGAKTEVVKGSAQWQTILNAPPNGTTIMLGDRRLVRMTATRVAAVQAWVRAGGNLIVEAEQPNFDDPLLAAYGIGHVGLKFTKAGWVERADRDDTKDEEAGLPFPLDPDNLPNEKDLDPKVVEALKKLRGGKKISDAVLGDGTIFRIEFRPYQNLRATKPMANAHVTTDTIGARIIQFADGKGRVSVISNYDFMASREIAKHDHAEFVWHMVATQNAHNAKTPRVLLALQDGDPGLWAWLGKHAWMVLIAALSLLLLWLLRIVQRFGPLQPIPTLHRRSLGEHLRALGRFVAAQKGWATLAHATRERFLKRLYRERPGLSRADKNTLMTTLEKLTGVGAARIERSLIAPVEDRRSFTDVVRSLKAIEHALEHHSK